VTGENANEFALGSAELVVQASEHSFCRTGLVVLDEVGRETGGRKR